MVRQELKNATKIRRKEQIAPSDQTPDRDRAADVIEEMWPATLTAIADESEFSRQHISNTLESYFVAVETEVDQQIQVPISVPEDGELTLQFEITISPETSSKD